MPTPSFALILRLHVVFLLVLLIETTVALPKAEAFSSQLIDTTMLFTPLTPIQLTDDQLIAIPQNNTTSAEPEINAEAAIVLDLPSRKVLFARNETNQLPPASTTKVATALAVLQHTQLDEWVKVPSNLYQVISGSMMKLAPGDELSRKDLLWGLLINSGNDAAYTLSQTYPEGEKKMIDDMNAIVKELNLSNSRFTNPIGFDNPNHVASAFDLAHLTIKALEYQEFREIVATPEAVIQSPSHPNISYRLENTNELLTETPGVLGVKTGWTEIAQGVLVTLVERSNHPLIVVVMGSNQRETDSLKLIEWAYAHHSW